MDFAFAVGGMLVLCMPAIAVKAVHELSGVDIRAVLLLMPLLLANLMPYFLPLGYLLAVVVTYGRFAADNEWTATRMAGIHPWRLIVPALPMALILGAGTYWLVSEKLPDLRRQTGMYKWQALRETITHLSPGRTELHLGKFSLIAGFRENDDFLQAVIYIPAMGGESARTLACERVRFEFQGTEMIIHVTNGRIVEGETDVQSQHLTLRLNLDELSTETDRNYQSQKYLTSRRIREVLADPAADPKRTDAMRFEVEQRTAVSTTYFMFLLLGIPTGLLLRRGTQLAALSVAVGYALLYYLLSLRLGKQLAMSQVVPPLVGAWVVNGLGVVSGFVLMWRAFRQ